MSDPVYSQAELDSAIADALRKAADEIYALAEWVPCDCGCPGAAAPKDARACAFLTAAGQLRIMASEHKPPEGLSE